jgi:hypothetical protein
MSLTPEQMESLLRLEAIFMPHAIARRNVLYENGTKDYARFVHYTSAEAALKIIRTKRVWMRNTTCMADYREVQHGYDILNRVFAANANLGRFHAALDACVPNAAAESFQLLINGGMIFDSARILLRFQSMMTAKISMGGCRCGGLLVAAMSLGLRSYSSFQKTRLPRRN